MTFKQFKTIAETHRNDVIVSRHGDYCNNKSKNTLGIIFIKNGKQSRVYDYSGSYADILKRLDIRVITLSDLETMKSDIERMKKWNGRKGMFSDKIIDYSEKIEKAEKELNYNLTSDQVVRIWEIG